jgi:hypothetical protein
MHLDSGGLYAGARGKTLRRRSARCYIAARCDDCFSLLFFRLQRIFNFTVRNSPMINYSFLV